MSKDKIKQIKVVSSDLERILDGLDDFGWIQFIDVKEEFVNATFDICKQAGIIKCLYELHLISKDDYVKMLKDLDRVVNKLNKHMFGFTDIDS